MVCNVKIGACAISMSMKHTSPLSLKQTIHQLKTCFLYLITDYCMTPQFLPITSLMTCFPDHQILLYPL
jgi:hypothetical protein